MLCLASPLLKGNSHELRMYLINFVCDNMPGFLATFRSRNLFFYLHGVISFAAKGLPYAGGFALRRCHLESNWKSSACLFQVNYTYDSFPLTTNVY